MVYRGYITYNIPTIYFCHHFTTVVGELVKPTFNPVDWGIFNVFYKGAFLNKTVKTNIPVNSGGDKVKAFFYIVSNHTDFGDATSYEYGIVRLGYDGNHVTKNKLSKVDGPGATVGLNVIFSSSEDGYVEITTTSTTLVRILCWG